MKILMAINVPNTRTGGPSRYMHYLQEELSRLGHEADLLFAEDIPRPLGAGRLTVLTFPILLLFVLWRLHLRRRYDVISIYTLGGAAYAWLRVFCKGLPPCIIVSHGSDELRWELEREEELLGYRPLGWRAKLLYYNLAVRQARYATLHADHVITMSSSEKEFYRTRHGMDPEKISVIPNGVAPCFFQDRDYSRRPERLLYLGGWEWRKGTRYLREAFVQLARQDPSLTLSLVGIGGSPSALQEFPSDVRSRVTIIPHVEAENVPQVYAAHDLFLFPTLFESIPLVVPEAMASGMPIVTTHVCGIPDILEDGVSALLAPPRDSQALARSVLRLLGDAPLRARLGRAAQGKARSITWDRIADRYLALYEKLLPGGGRP